MRVDLTELLSTDLSTLDQTTLQAQALQVQQLIGQLTGHVQRILSELDTRHDGRVVTNPGSEHAPLYRLVQHWWRDAATLTGHEAGRQLRAARTLHQLPQVEQAVVDGTLAPEQARVLGRLVGRIAQPDLVESQPQLIQVAQPLDVDALGRWVSNLIATHCEPALEADQARAHERRYLQLRTDSDGTVHGRFLLASEDAEAMLTVLEPLARRTEQGDQRSSGQRRADALVEVFTAASAWMELPHAGGQRTQLSYVLPADWAAGHPPPPLPEQLSASCGGHPLDTAVRVASGAWTGPQTRARIESLLCDARISRVLLNPDGQVVSLDSLTDQITTAQRRAVSARDRHCVAKGCTRPPAFCDVHHLQSRADGGTTHLGNLVLLCRRHHVLWHKGLIGLHDLHLPWLPEPQPDEDLHDPWTNPPLVA